MRNVEFKVWCKDNNEWEKNICLMDDKGNLLHETRTGYIHLRPENHIAVFYTGFRDKENNKIFESYIIRCHGIEQGNKYYFDCIVKFKDGEFYLDEFGFDEWDLKKTLEYYDCEVVGNIYQNPELLPDSYKEAINNEQESKPTF